MKSLSVLHAVGSKNAIDFTNLLSELAERDVHCEVVSVYDYPRLKLSEGRSPFDFLFFYPRLFYKSFQKFDLIHAHNGLTPPFAVAQPNLPTVISFWGTDLMGPYGWINKTASQFGDEIVVKSDTMKDRLGRDAHVVPSGVDTDMFSPESQLEAQTQLGWGPNKKHVIFPYPPERDVKNFPRAKQVVERANRETDMNIELQVVTDVPHNDVVTYMNAADVMLLTSKREGSPKAVKEALACNLPIVSTDVGDVNQRLRGVSPSAVGKDDDEIVNLLSDILQSGNRSNGRKVVRKLDWGCIADKIIDVYASAL